MNQLQVFKNELFEVSAKFANGEVLFDVEKVAISLGITTIVGGTRYVRWNRVNQYLPRDLPQVAKGDFIPEPLVYKLAFKASNDIAEKFQDWLAIEVIPSIRKTGSYQIEKPKSQAELMLMFAEQFVNQEKEIKELKTSVKQTNDRLDDVSTIVALNPKDWRSEVNKIINSIAFKAGKEKSYQDIRKESYQLLEARAKCDLERRLQNKRKNMALEGESKTKIEKSNKLDVIEGDSRLTEIYLAIIKELAIKYQVSLDRRVI